MQGVAREDIAFSSVEFLLLELSNYVIRQKLRMEDACNKMELAGVMVGERLSERLTREKNRMTDELEIIKFLCKDFWSEVFLKQADQLQTNRRGIYVVQDLHFRWLEHIDPDEGTPHATLYSFYAAGVLKGCLCNLGIPVTIKPEIFFPKCIF